MFTFFPEDPAQRHRISRYLMAVAASLVVLVILVIEAWSGAIQWRNVANLALIALAMFALFYVLLRSGLNLHFEDPSLALEMVAVSLAYILFAVALSRTRDFTLLLLLMLPMGFGIFRLGTRQLLLLSAFVVAGFQYVLAMRGSLVPGEAGFRDSIATLIILGLTLITFSIMGGHITALRLKLARGRRKLENAVTQIEHIAAHDDLTGLYNRRYLEQRLREEVSRSQRYGASFSICLFDLDRFKAVNDTYGHAAGDQVLKSFADSVRGILREPDCFGRWGGEEFLLLMPETDADAARSAAERIVAAQRVRVMPGLPADARVTVSGGVACFRPTETSIDPLMHRADAALYRAKDRGRDRLEMEAGD